MMNRRSLLALGAGLIVGEPARRAYSFLNGSGFDLTMVAGDGYSSLATQHGLKVLYYERFSGSLGAFLKRSAELDANARAAYGPGILL